MKIIYVENVRIPSERAHAYQIVQTCAWFARAGHDVTLVNPDRAGGKDVFSAYGLEPDLFRHVTLGVIDALSFGWLNKKFAYIVERWSFMRALRSWISGQGADVWYTRDPAIVDALKGAERRIVLELHSRPDSNPGRWSRMKEHVDRFIVISNGLKDTLTRLGVPADRISVAPDGFDPRDFEDRVECTAERQHLSIPRDAFVVMYTGSFYPWKGVDLIVRAWKNAPLSAHLVLIGGPEDDRRRLAALVETETKSRIHIFPRMERRDAIRALAAADVGLLSTSPAFEIGRAYTSPIKQFEYLAAGLPILASDVPSSHEVLDEHVAKFFDYTAEGLVSALHELVSDASWRDRAGREARTFVKPYTWEARANHILDAIQ